jgi:CubicO group peptidase (beta-lactamase class C family)
MRGVGVGALLSLISFLWLWLAVTYSTAQCPIATFSPWDVVPNFDQNNITDQLADQIASLTAKIPPLFQSYQVDTYAVAVVYRNKTIYSTGMVDTHFRIGSVTKVFAAMGALVLRQRGLLELDDPVKKFLPSFSIISPYDDPHDITLRELMGHLSGLPRDLCAGLVLCPSNLCPGANICGPEFEQEILRFVAQMQLVRPPWSGIPNYSNLGFALLGHAWEKATSPPQTWGDFVQTEILGQLGMHDTGSNLTNVKLAPGNVILVDVLPANTSIGWIAPAGDMYSTAMDLAKFLMFLLNPVKELLSATAVREWTKPTTVFPDAVKEGSALSGFALPWEFRPLTMTNNQTTNVITKNGGLGTYLSDIAFHPDSQLGVVVLSSKNTTAQDTYPGPGTISSQILEGLIPAVESIHSKLISSMYSGVYTCKRSDAPMVIPNGSNVTVQVLGGNISVPAMAPGNALEAVWNIAVSVNGVEVPVVGTTPLVLKPVAAGEQSFWAYPYPCSSIAGALSVNPEFARPNFPGSVYDYELRFDPGKNLITVPSYGGECYK